MAQAQAQPQATGALDRMRRYLDQGDTAPIDGTAIPIPAPGVGTGVGATGGALDRVRSFLDSSEVGPTVGEQIGAGAESAARSAVGSLGFIGGARLGAMAPVPLPLKLVTGLAGGIAGYLAGNSGVDLFETGTGTQLRSPEEFSPELRPAAIAGDVLGGSISGAGALTGMAKAGVRASGEHYAGKFLNRILDNAATRPVAFMTAEGTAAASAALFEALSEHYSPGNDFVRMGAGTVAGGVNPAAHLIRGGIKGYDIVKSFLKEGDALSGLATSGTPEDLLNAAKTRRGKTREFLNSLLSRAEQKAVDLVGNMQHADDLTIRAAEKKINDLLAESYGTARRVENVLASRVLNTPFADTKIKANSVLSLYEELVKDRLSGLPKLPVDIESFMRMSEQQLRENIENIPEETVSFIGALRDLMPSSGFKVATVGDMIRLRNRAVKLSTTLSKRGIDKYDEANALAKIGEAALDDLSLIPEAQFKQLKEYTEYGHILNETFTKPFVDTIARKALAGEKRTNPEMIGTELIRSGSLQSAQHYADLRQAIANSLDMPPSVKNVSGVLNRADVAARWNELAEAQQTILRHAAADTIQITPGKGYGKVDVVALAKFRRDNGSLLKQFPELQHTLGNAQNAQVAFENLEQKVNQVRKGTNLIRDVAGSDDPVLAIAAALTNKNYKQSIKQLANTVKRAGGDAPEGLFSTVVQAGLQSATDRKSGAVSVHSLKEFLDGRNSVLKELQVNGIIDEHRVNTMRRFLDVLIKQEQRRKSTLNTTAGMVSDFVNRLYGIHAASRLADVVGMPSAGRLSVASMGSRLGQKILGSVPEAMTGEMFAAVMKSPVQMENIIRQTQSPTDRIRQFALLHGYLLQMGLAQIRPEAPQAAQLIAPMPMTPAAPLP